MAWREGVLILAAVASLGLSACRRGSEADEHSTAGAPVPKGASGKSAPGTNGTNAMGGPGSGLQGGMAPPGSASQPTGVAEGTRNSSPRNNVGSR